jgi:hypothetical protein
MLVHFAGALQSGHSMLAGCRPWVPRQLRLHTFDQYLGAANTSNIDKQRVGAVRKLEQLGYTFAGDWHPPAGVIAANPTSADAMHALLLQRADAIEGCAEGSEEERELAMITDAIEAYETVRWPNGKVDGGKG